MTLSQIRSAGLLFKGLFLVALRWCRSGVGVAVFVPPPWCPNASQMVPPTSTPRQSFRRSTPCPATNWRRGQWGSSWRGNRPSGPASRPAGDAAAMGGAGQVSARGSPGAAAAWSTLPPSGTAGRGSEGPGPSAVAGASTILPCPFPGAGRFGRRRAAEWSGPSAPRRRSWGGARPLPFLGALAEVLQGLRA